MFHGPAVCRSVQHLRMSAMRRLLKRLPWPTQYRFAGLHQVPKMPESRGLLIAAAGKNTPDDVWARWRYL